MAGTGPPRPTMSRERRNLYRLLHVQPEAPPEVIKAAWRALMSTLRAHPDLGGDTEQAARLNAAYEVLSDPERRRAYDLSLRRGGRSAAAPPAAPAAAALCPFCGHPRTGAAGRDERCAACGSPLTPAPSGKAGGEILGRRHDARVLRDAEVEVWRPGDRQARPGRLRDLSFSGLSLLMTEPVPAASVLRLRTPQFEALVRVVTSRRQAVGHSVHAQLLTLHLGP